MSNVRPPQPHQSEALEPAPFYSGRAAIDQFEQEAIGLSGRAVVELPGPVEIELLDLAEIERPGRATVE